ncbi:MarR family winged helix-turn-helix transcriptional regulator [Wenzhouxiangella sediminis]|uniref:MarR family winged helix-turn-helix transcriptional regulator n=1 Tax=Wenzhouxiangella sediminis TaxID=1792836 RepID=UPI001C6ED962|nr:MarR family winged helix-turn-helix transcriptional regulator [Wenzhouxiangella sediminis]
MLRSQDWQKAERADLTATQGQILSQLHTRGPARVGAIAEALGVAQPTATTAVGALVRKGLVEKRADPADARASLLHLTRAGRRKAQAFEGVPEALLAAVDELDESERAAFLRSLTKMIRSLQRQRAIPVQRMCATCVHFRPNVHDDADAPHHCAFVDAAFGDAKLRLDCGDHEALPDERAVATWRRFVDAGSANETDAPSAATDEAS